MIRRLLLAGLLLPLVLAPRLAAAEPRILPDSTVLDIWQLSNGLRVVVRHISTAPHVAMTVAWPTGSDADPPGLSGRAALLSELELTAPAGDAPERTRAEMSEIRPAGWGAGVSPRVTQLTEIATRAQFPGALHQLSQRLRGVTVDDSVLKHALASTHADLRQERSPTSNAELYKATHELARGSYDPAAAEAGWKALAKLKLPEVQSLVRQSFPVSGAVLSLAGDLGDMNLPALIQNEFGGIPAGTKAPDPPARALTGGAHRDVVRPGVPRPIGGLAIVAPALDDSLHPWFYLATLFLGGYAQREWQGPLAPLTTRFQYSLYDDPDLAHFYPPAGPGTAADSAISWPFDEMVSKLGAMVFPRESYEEMLRGVTWLLGDPMPHEILMRTVRDPGVLATLSSNQAVRELWGGEPFWREYRSRLRPEHMKDFYSWVTYLLDPQHRVQVLLRPSAH